MTIKGSPKTPQSNKRKAKSPKSNNHPLAKSPMLNKKAVTPEAKKQKSPKQNTPLVTPEAKKPIKVPKSQTPQPTKPQNTPKAGNNVKQKTPKSEPQPKRKLLEEELDEELSDEDFDALLKHVSKKEQLKKAGKLDRSAAAEDEDDDEDDDDEDDSEQDEDDDEDADSDDELDDDDLDGSEDEGSEEDESEDEAPPAKKAKTDKAKAASVEDSEPKKSKSQKKRELAKKKKAIVIEKVASVLKEELDVDAQRRAQRDLRSLFVKNLPQDCDQASLRALSADIREVRIHYNHKSRKGKVRKSLRYAFLEFDDEAAADKNITELKGKKVGDCEILVDYVGAKSATHKNDTNRTELAVVDPRKLYVSGFPLTINQDAMKSLFPASIDIHIPIRAKTGLPCGYAFVFFSSDDSAKAAHDRLHDTQYDGHKLVVLFAKKTKDLPGEKRKAEKRKSGEAAVALEKQKTEAKKAKKAKVVEEAKNESGESDDDGESGDGGEESDDGEEIDSGKEGEGDEATSALVEKMKAKLAQKGAKEDVDQDSGESDDDDMGSEEEDDDEEDDDDDEDTDDDDDNEEGDSD